MPSLGGVVIFNVIPVKTGIQIHPNHETTFEMPNWGFRPVSEYPAYPEYPAYRVTLFRRNDEIKVRKDGSLILTTPPVCNQVGKCSARVWNHCSSTTIQFQKHFRDHQCGGARAER